MFGSSEAGKPLLVAFLPVCSHSHWQVHLSRCGGIPSPVLEPASSGFQQRLKTRSSPGTPQDYNPKLELLSYLTLRTEKLLDSWPFRVRQPLSYYPGQILQANLINYTYSLHTYIDTAMNTYRKDLNQHRTHKDKVLSTKEMCL